MSIAVIGCGDVGLQVIAAARLARDQGDRSVVVIDPQLAGVTAGGTP